MNPIILEGKRVKLLPMSSEHVEALYEAGRDPSIWDYLPKTVNSIEDMNEIVLSALKMKETGVEYPFVVDDQEKNEVVGSTRLLNISHQNRNVEIGWTWFTPSVWRSRVNTECKYLMLSYCFEVLKCVRVQLKADVRNERSNRAILRLGAQREGELRQDRIYSNGYVRNAFIYSIIDNEWPGVKSKLEGYLER